MERSTSKHQLRTEVDSGEPDLGFDGLVCHETEDSCGIRRYEARPQLVSRYCKIASTTDPPRRLDSGLVEVNYLDFRWIR